MRKMRFNKLIKLLILLSMEIQFIVGDTSLQVIMKSCCGVPATTVIGTFASRLPGIRGVYKDPCFEELTQQVKDMGGESKIDEDKFKSWCNRFHTQGQAKSAALVIANINNNWTTEVQDLVLEVTEKYKCGPRFFIDNRQKSVSLFYLYTYLGNDLYDFWTKFNEKYGLTTDIMCQCLKYNDECLTFFWRFFINQNYKSCNGALVSDMFDAYSKGKNEQELGMYLTTKFSPRGKYYHSIVHDICENVPMDKPDSWGNKQVKMLLFRIRDFDWTSGYDQLLIIRNKDIELFTENDDPYEDTLDNDKWNMDAFVLYIHTGCYLIKNREKGTKDIFPFGSGGNLKNCMYYIAHYSDLAKNFYKFNIAHGFELLVYNEFEKKIIRQDDHNNLRYSENIYNGMDWLKKELMKAIEIYYPDSDKDDILQKIVAADDSRIGLRALLSLVLNFRPLPQISDESLILIIEKFVSIPVTSKINEEEIAYNQGFGMVYEKMAAKPDFYKFAVRDVDVKLIDARNTYGYKPPDNYTFDTEKRWGKVVFTAIYATCMNLRKDNIQLPEFVSKLMTCIDDVAEYKPRQNATDKFCGLFNRNPYFGEFHNVILNSFNKKINELIVN